MMIETNRQILILLQLLYEWIVNAVYQNSFMFTVKKFLMEKKEKKFISPKSHHIDYIVAAGNTNCEAVKLITFHISLQDWSKVQNFRFNLKCLCNLQKILVWLRFSGFIRLPVATKWQSRCSNRWGA